MQTIVYRISLSTKDALSRLGPRAMIVFVFLLVLIMVFEDLAKTRHPADLAKFDSLDLDPVRILLVLSLVALAWSLTVIAGNLYAIRPSRNFMTLDESGLTYVRFGFRQQWAWRDLPELGVTVHPDGAKVVEFRPPPAGDWRAYLGSWAVWMAGGWFARGGRTVRISDDYDTPLQEVADRLNEYREQAVGAIPDRGESN